MAAYTFKQQANTSLREKVTNDLREAILHGHLAPGARIKELDIAEQMGISRGPIREAIRQLEREGLLISYPYKETVVADLDLEEVQLILLPIRLHIESYVVQRHAGKMNEAFFARMQAIIDEMEVALREGRNAQLVDLDIRFHQTILELATERTVLLTWQSIINQIRLHFTKNLPFYKSENIRRDHQELLDALKTRDPDVIRTAIAKHLEDGDSLLCFE